MSLLFAVLRLVIDQISSPADPTLLHFKLNKLQQSQTGSPRTASPQASLDEHSQQHSLAGSPFSRQRHVHSLSLAAAPFFPGVPQFLSPTTSHAPPLPRMSPFGGSDGSNPDAPFVPMHLHRSPLPPSSLRSVSETEDEDGEEKEADENASPPIFAPQATAPIQPGAFHGVTNTAEEEPTPAKEDRPNFAIGFGLDQDVDDMGHTSFGQQPLDLAEFGDFIKSHAPEATNSEKELDEIDAEIDDGVTEGAFITPSHSRQVSCAINAALNQPPPRQNHQPGLSTASVQSMMRIDELRPPNPHDTHNTGIEAGDENGSTREREMSVFTDDYAGGDEKENIPPPTMHGDLGYGWPRPAANADVALERRASAEDWTNPSAQSLRPAADGEVWTNSENDEISGEYLDAHSDDEVGFS
jgi:hypothetical protein